MDGPKLSRLLIVDDESELVAALCETLKTHGYETEGFTAGKKALGRLKKEGFDVLLTDLMMPEMDGIALLEAALKIDPELIGIIMTGQGTVQTAVDAMKKGAFDYIMKPFKMNTLLPTISRAIGVRNLKKENIELRATLAIYELTKVITLTTDLNIIANKVADAAMEQTQADEVSILLPIQDDYENEMYVAAVRGLGRDHLLGQRIKVDQGIAGWTARHHKLVQLEGEVNDPRFKPIHPRSDIKTGVSIPMMSGGKFVGVLNLNAVTNRSFTVGQIKALTITISMAAPSIENARLFNMLQTAEAKYRNIFENAMEGIFQVSPAGRFITANPALAAVLNYQSPEELMRSITDIPGQTFVDRHQHGLLMEAAVKKGRVIGFEAQVYRKGGDSIWISMNAQTVRDSDGHIHHFEGSLKDITDRKQAEVRQILFLQVLDLLNQPHAKGDLMQRMLIILKEHIGVEAMGIRLREGEDFPYFETKGFPDSFIELERYLCARDQDGRIIRDSQGNPYLECMCGNIICGRTDSSLPFFTEKGSFWTNSTTKLLASTTEEDRQTRTRNRCHGEGYESVALIPLRSGDQIIGLLQLNDRKPNRFTLDRIEFLEGIGASIGIGLERIYAEEAVKRSEEKYRSIFENAIGGIYQSTPEGQFISVNPSMARIHGFASPEELKESITASGQQLFVNPEDQSVYKKLIEEQGKIEGYEVEMFKKDGGKIWMSIDAQAVKDAEGKVLYYEGITENITRRKEAEASLKQSLERLKKALEGIIETMVMTVEIRDPYTSGHQKRVADLACSIADELGLTTEQIDGIRMAGMVHDLGKIYVPAEILIKPTKLSDIEFSIIREHPAKGYDILKDIEFPYPVASIILQHHERLNGSGYPQGLKNGQILTEAKIIAVADVVEAIASHRPYRPALGIEVALEEITKNKGLLYDPGAVEACLGLFREKGFGFE